MMRIPTIDTNSHFSIFAQREMPVGIHIKRRIGNLVSVYADREEINKLEKMGYKFVGPDMTVHIFLQDSVKIINATEAWSKNVSNESLNGSQISVCVIDSGVDANHPSLRGKVLAQKCFCSSPEGNNTNCCYGNLSESDNATDNNGHGTHVSGIIAASGGINGIAKGANIVAVKVMNSSGSGSSSDVAAGIQWCSNGTQIKKYNISVISLSLGSGQYFSFKNCPDYSGIGALINATVSKNVSVVVATGNTGNGFNNSVAGISTPACLPNVIRVSAVDKADDYAPYAFRDINFSDILLAPGTDINSTFPTYSVFLNSEIYAKNYAQLSGTSMATPMVSGAIAIMSQYLKLTNKMKTPLEIKNILRDTGKSIYDNVSGGTFSRINIYGALLNLDSISPVVALVSPSDNGTNSIRNQTFVCNATDWQLKNMTLKIWDNLGLFFNESKNLTGTENKTFFNVKEMPSGKYLWDCFSSDMNGNIGHSLSNYSLTIEGVYTELKSPFANNYTNVSNANFSCQVVSLSDNVLKNLTFYLWNSSGNLEYNLTKNISGFDNISNFNYTFVSDGNYSWNCLGVNNVSNKAFGKNNFSLVYDEVAPNLTLTRLPSNSQSNSVLEIFGFNISDKNIKNCSLIIGGKVVLTNSSMGNLTRQFFEKRVGPGFYSWKIGCSDFAGNVNFSMENNFTVTTVPVSSSSSSGSGGGGYASPITITPQKFYIVNPIELSKGYTKNIREGNRINFSVSNLKSGQYLLTVRGVGINYANITIESSSVNLTLFTGESIKLNLTSNTYYDLLIKVGNISNGKAKLFLQSVSIPIANKLVRGRASNSVVDGKKIKDKTNVVKYYSWIKSILLLFLILILISWINRNKLKARMYSKKGNGKNKKIKT